MNRTTLPIENMPHFPTPAAPSRKEALYILPTPYACAGLAWVTNADADPDAMSANLSAVLSGLVVGPPRPTDSIFWDVWQRDPKMPRLVGLYGPTPIAQAADAYREAAGK